LDYSRKVIFSILAVALFVMVPLAYAAVGDFILSFVGTGVGGGGNAWTIQMELQLTLMIEY